MTSLEDTLRTARTLVGDDGAATIEQRPSATITPDLSLRESVDEQAAKLLGRLERRSFGSGTGDAVELHGTIGQGGMGVVRLGTQHSLGRPVAVKTLKEGFYNDASVLELLREAWVTGRLEHPNIVPVYDIALDPDGRPQIVLKKIEGNEWGSLMHAPDLLKSKGIEDLVEWNLQILIQVCNAVHFAHCRGVLHRDLKPENVMLGPFGEVYVVDWGIAVSLDDDGEPWLPRARDATEMAGTPLYMAPEMLGWPESRLSARTDVYLLGAILYEIVTGHAPHRGNGLMQILAAILTSEPVLPEDVPRELARIIRRAMARDPEARFESAEDVRLSLLGFLRHRAGAKLAERARAHLTQLDARLHADTRGSEAREAIYDLFGECRFGFRHALEVWPDNDEAREQLDQASRAMVEYELAQGEPEAARALLGEMNELPEGLAGRVAEACRSRAEEEAELRRVSADQDPDLERRTRLLIATFVGGGWIAAPLAIGVTEDVGIVEPTHGMLFGNALFFTALFIGLGTWARKAVMRTAINRRMAGATILAMAAMALITGVASATGQPPSEGPTLSLLAFAAIAAMVALSVDRGFVVSALGYAAGYVWSELVGYHGYVMAACNLVLLLSMYVLWGRARARA